MGEQLLRGKAAQLGQQSGSAGSSSAGRSSQAVQAAAVYVYSHMTS